MSKKETHFVGLGGAGSNAIEFLYTKGIKGKFTYISHPKRIDLPNEIKFIHFIPPGESYSINGVEKFRISDLKQKIRIPQSVLDIFNSNDRFILLSGLGGYTGSFLTAELTLLLNKQKKNFLTISSLPLKMESKESRTLALKTVNKLKYISVFKHYKLEDLKLKYHRLRIDKFFEKANKQIYEIFKNNTEE